jgi:hypothetical protein
MADLLAMNPLYLILYISIFIIIVVTIAIVITYSKSIKRRKNDTDKIKLIVSYMEDGFRNGYTAEDMVSYLMINGWSLIDCNRALKYLGRKPV